MYNKSILLLTLIAATSLAEVHQNGDKLVTDFTGMTVEEALSEIADTTGIGIVTSQALDKEINVKYPQLTVEQLLNRLLYGYNSMYLHDDNGKLKKVRIFAGNTPKAPGKAKAAAELPSESRQQNGKYYLTVRLNGKTLKMLVDTGANITALSQATAASLGLVGNSQLTTVNTAGGKVAARHTVIDSVEMAGKTLKGVQAVIMPQLQEKGLIGQNILAHYRHTTEAGKMQFTAIGGALQKQPKQQPDNTQKPASVPISPTIKGEG